MLVMGAVGASAAYVWMALAQGAALIPGVIAPQALLGISFAVLIAPLTASVLSSVTPSDEGLASGPFYGYNRPGAKVSQAIIWNWWRQGMMGGAKAHYDGIVAISQTDFTEDLKKIAIPVLVMHGDDDQIVPYVDSGPLSAKLLRSGT
jgi:pimeloyl-ACP methyl ester carboxylesterase